jgi:uncharacterized membrane protein YdbT with pleckstrin-like domain
MILGLIVMAFAGQVWWALTTLVFISLGFTLYYYILLHSFVLSVNDTAVQIRLGWLSHTTSTITLRKIESTALHQSLMGRSMNYGRIEFKGTGGTSDFSATIANPGELKAEIEKTHGSNSKSSAGASTSGKGKASGCEKRPTGKIRRAF